MIFAFVIFQAAMSNELNFTNIQRQYNESTHEIQTKADKAVPSSLQYTMSMFTYTEQCAAICEHYP